LTELQKAIQVLYDSYITDLGHQKEEAIHVVCACQGKKQTEKAIKWRKEWLRKPENREGKNEDDAELARMDDKSSWTSKRVRLTRQIKNATGTLDNIERTKRTLFNKNKRTLNRPFRIESLKVEILTAAHYAFDKTYVIEAETDIEGSHQLALVTELQRCTNLGTSQNRLAVRMAYRCGKIVMRLRTLIKNPNSTSNMCSIGFLHTKMKENDSSVPSKHHLRRCFNFATFCKNNVAPLFPLTYQGKMEDILGFISDDSLQKAFALAVQSEEYLAYKRNVFVKVNGL